MAVVDTKTIPFGQSDITIEMPNGDIVKFDGKEELQAEGAEMTITPSLEDIVIADYGTGPFDKRVVGYEATVTIRAARQTHETIRAALTSVVETVDASTSDVVGLADAPIGTSLRDLGVKVTLKPRNLTEAEAGVQKVTFHKMVADGDFSRTFGNEQSNIEINYSLLPKDGMDPSKPGNFFYFGDAPSEESQPAQ